jgi:two-component system KDP operon response regulator KdpE
MPEPDTVVKTPDFVMHLANRTVDRPDGTPIRLTPIEWQIVDFLARQPGRLVPQRRLLDEVWGPITDDGAALRVHLTHIRRKLEPEPSRPRYFITESGIGYRFMAD